MDVVLFTVTAACCFYRFASSASSPTDKQQQRNRYTSTDGSHNNISTRRCTIETKPLLSHFVQDWIREFPHLAASLGGDIIIPPTTTNNDDDDSSQPPQAQAQPRVVGLLIDTSSSNSRDAASSSFLLEKAVAANDSLKMVYLANDWAPAETHNSVDMHHPHHCYKPVSFGLSAFTNQADDEQHLRHNLLFNVQRFLQVCAKTVMEMIGIKNPSVASSDTTAATTTTTTLRLVHSITGLVMTKEGWNHCLNMNTAASFDHGNSSHSSSSSHGSKSNNNARAANPQDNWIEI